MNPPAYPKYKPSGIERLGHVPEHNNMIAYIPDKKNVISEWAFYWMSIFDFGLLTNSGAVPSLSEEYQSVLPIIPFSDEQKAIADYLDKKPLRIISTKRLVRLMD